MSQPQTTRRRRRTSFALGLGLFLALSGVLLVALLISVWPAVEDATGAGGAQQDGQAQAGAASTDVSMSFFGLVHMDVTSGTALLILVAVVGALGSFIHASTSFVEYVGNRRLERSWAWWYLLRLPIGASLALVLYVAFRGGLFATSATTGDVNIYGVAAIAAVTGLFSKQATSKLEELFTTLFRVAEGKGDERLEDSLAHEQPTVTGTEPPRLTAQLETTLIVRGTGFDETSQVRLTRLATAEVLEAQTTFIDPTRLSVLLTVEDVADAGRLELVVVNPPPGGGTSPPVLVDIDPPEGLEPLPETTTDAEADAELEAEAAAETAVSEELPPDEEAPPPRGG
jgi:hypothetical protein